MIDGSLMTQVPGAVGTRNRMITFAMNSRGNPLRKALPKRFTDRSADCSLKGGYATGPYLPHFDQEEEE
jgi:hypothetical protein